MALCGHSEPWSEAWPAWGMSAGGAAFALPTPVPLTDASASLSLPTPQAVSIESTPEVWESRAKRHAANGVGLQRSLSAEAVGLAIGQPVNLEAAKSLPTPTASMATGAGTSGRDGGPNLQTAIVLLPTPTSRDHKGRNQRNDTTCLPGALLTSAPTPPPSDGGNTC